MDEDLKNAGSIEAGKRLANHPRARAAMEKIRKASKSNEWLRIKMAKFLDASDRGDEKEKSRIKQELCNPDQNMFNPSCIKRKK